MSIDIKGTKDPTLDDIEFHQGIPVEIKTDVSVVENLVILPKNVLRRTLLQVKCNTEKKKMTKHRGSSHL